MNALFVHGICGSNIFYTPTLIRFRTQGINPFIFGYSVTIHDFQTIVSRLVKKMIKISEKGEYVVIAHSLGGIIVRAAMDQLQVKSQRPKMAFLLGSPVEASRVARYLGKSPIVGAIIRDCGNLLGSSERMKKIPKPKVPTYAIIGTRGLKGNLTPFGTEENDGVVTKSEVEAEWYREIIRVPVPHNLLTSSRKVSAIILSKIESKKKK